MPYAIGYADGGIAGGGFDDLELYGCTVQAPRAAPPEGLSLGVPGINVQVRRILLVDSTVTASANLDDQCTGERPGQAGVYAPGANVTLVASVATGSTHSWPCFPGAVGCPSWLQSGHLGTPDAGPEVESENWTSGAGVQAATLELLDGAQAFGGPPTRYTWFDPDTHFYRRCPGRGFPGRSFVVEQGNVTLDGILPVH